MPIRADHLVTVILPGGHEASFTVAADEYILDAALEAGLDIPYRCLQGWCLSCAARVRAGRINVDDSRRYYPGDREEGFALLCTGRPESDLVLESHARDAMAESRKRRGLPYPRGRWGGGPHPSRAS